MQASQLMPASKLALRYGVKALCYGPPGSGKTPLVNTAPRPVMLVTEPGMLSMRNSSVPCWQADNEARIAEFFEWLAKSNEHKKFDTVAVDSTSQIAEIILMAKMNSNRDGRKAYGEMANTCMEWFDQLFFMQEKHVFLIAKETTYEEQNVTFSPVGVPIIQSETKRTYYFPGKELYIKLGHRYDEIIHAGRATIPGVGEQRVLRCQPSTTIHARDRSGLLSEFEPHDLTALFKKAMG